MGGWATMEVMKALVLTYHSHNISGSAYAENDHVALASDLATITDMGARIVGLDEIVKAIHRGLDLGSGTLVGLTFDDGPVFDYADFQHPRFGPQRGFLNILRDFHRGHGAEQPNLHATSFVIASPEARREMERAEECGYTFLSDWLTDAWWNDAIDTGLLGIGNHSWDHVHPVIASVSTASQQRGNFSLIASEADADAEVRTAAKFINARTGGRCHYFAYPFGHVSEYLATDYLPRRQDRHGMRAAFATGGRAIHAGDPVWNIPRAVCGEHWRSPAELEALLAS